MAEGAAEPAGRGRVPWLFLAPIGVFAALAILFAVRLGAGDPSRLPSTLIGRPAPAVTMPPLAGLADAGGAPVPGLDPAALGQGGVTVVNVWASWCAPCRIEHPLLTDLARRGTARIVGINYKDTPDSARRFLGTFGNPFAAVGVDADGRGGIEWGVYGVPETFVVGPDGTVRYKHVGALTPETMAALLAAIARAGRAP